MDPLRTKIVVTYTCFWFRSFTKKPLVLLLTHNWPITDLLLTPKFPEGGNKENTNLVKSTWQKRTQGYFNFPSGNRKTRGKIQNNTLFIPPRSTMPLNMICKSLWYWKMLVYLQRNKWKCGGGFTRRIYIVKSRITSIRYNMHLPFNWRYIPVDYPQPEVYSKLIWYAKKP